MYETIELDRLARLIPFARGFRLERALVHVTKDLGVQVNLSSNRVDAFFLHASDALFWNYRLRQIHRAVPFLTLMQFII